MASELPLRTVTSRPADPLHAAWRRGWGPKRWKRGQLTPRTSGPARTSEPESSLQPFDPILIKFGTVTHFGPLQPVKISNLQCRNNITFLQIEDGGGRHLENHKIAMSPQRFDGSLRKLVQRCKMGVLTTPTVKNLNFINPRWRTPSFWKPINYNISANVFYHCWWNFAPWWTIPISETVVSLYNLKKSWI